MLAVSLFASGGIGDLALRASGVDMVVACELLEDRADILSYNFPDSKVVVGDIWEKQDEIVSLCSGKSIEVMFATPPCQGMSKNGRGKLLSEIRNGNKQAGDKRNQLVVPTINIFKKLNSLHTLVMENVPEMESTYIQDPDSGNPILIIDYILKSLGSEFKCECRVVEFADYGVPQRRQRLISVFSSHKNFLECRDMGLSVFPEPTHAKKTTLFCPNPWLTVRDAISDLPPLDARSAQTAKDIDLPLHEVPLLDKTKYFWVSNTPPESGAFDNQCVVCGCEDNPLHVSRKNKDGINQSSKETPIYCQNCGSLLPRPHL